MDFVVKILQGAALAALLLLQACGGADPGMAVPRDAAAVLAVDASAAGLLPVLGGELGGLAAPGGKAYAFVDGSGEFCVCAATAGEDAVEETLERLRKAGRATGPVQRRGYGFCVVDGSWVAGYGGKLLAATGPVAATGVGAAMNRLAGLLSSESGEESPLVSMADSIGAPVSLAARVSALPEKIAPVFMVGAGKDTKPSAVIVVARVDTVDGCLVVKGRSVSHDKAVDKDLQTARSAYGGIGGRFLSGLRADAKVSLVANVDGPAFVGQLHGSAPLAAMLAGANAIVDLDKILKSVSGDISISVDGLDGGGLSVFAETSGSGWVEDVGYWMQSVPKGGRMVQTGDSSYSYSGGGREFNFGLDGSVFYGVSSKSLLEGRGKSAARPLPGGLLRLLRGAKLAVVANTEGLPAVGGSFTHAAYIME